MSLRCILIGNKINVVFSFNAADIFGALILSCVVCKCSNGENMKYLVIYATTIQQLITQLYIYLLNTSTMSIGKDKKERNISMFL